MPTSNVMPQGTVKENPSALPIITTNRSRAVLRHLIPEYGRASSGKVELAFQQIRSRVVDEFHEVLLASQSVLSVLH